MVPLNFISPFFIVNRLSDSLSFYVDKLGFEVVYTGPDDGPFFGIVKRDNVFIMLKHITEDIKPIPNSSRHPWASWDAYISISEPEALFEEYRSRGVAFRQPLLNNSDGLRGFEVEDTDGYVLFFGRPNK